MEGASKCQKGGNRLMEGSLKELAGYRKKEFRSGWRKAFRRKGRLWEHT